MLINDIKLICYSIAILIIGGLYMKNNRLTEGPITSSLIKLALPIMLTAFVQMAYNLTDMIWLGRLNTEALAAAGTAGFFTWLGSAIITISRIGAEVRVAQSYGSGEIKTAKKYVENSLQLNTVLAILYTLILLMFKNPLIGFFNIGDPEVIQMTKEYLTIVSFGMLFFFTNPVFSGIYNGSGDGITPLKVNSVGLITNIILDPIMIFGLGPIPAMGIKGAAYATVLAQVLVTMIFLFISINKKELFTDIHIFRKFKPDYLKNIIDVGIPVAIQSGLFAIIAMVITRIIAKWGSKPIAVQNVGSQIESITWMTSDGFLTALSAFVGQNYGANKPDRIREGYKKGLMIVGSIGIFSTLLLFFFAEPIFKIFIPEDPEALLIGINYLKILALSQFFMSIEKASQGAFNGIGKTKPPAVVSVGLNILRIPGALILSSTALGLDGVWWSISLTSILKGIVLTVWFVFELKNLKIKHDF